MNQREEMMKELSNANKTLQKYEDKILKGEVNDEDRDFFLARVAFWSDSIIELRKALFHSQQTIQTPPL